MEREFSGSGDEGRRLCVVHGWLSEKQAGLRLVGQKAGIAFKLSLRKQKSSWLIAEHREDLGESATSNQPVHLSSERQKKLQARQFNNMQFNV